MISNERIAAHCKYSYDWESDIFTTEIEIATNYNYNTWNTIIIWGHKEERCSFPFFLNMSSKSQTLASCVVTVDANHYTTPQPQVVDKMM